MAKKSTSKKWTGGPFVTAALLCHSITEDSDGVLSAMRIVDEIRVMLPHDAPEDFPSKDKPLEMALFALIIIRRGDAHSGKHRLRLVMERPNGETSEAMNQDIEMPPYPNATANIKVRMVMKLYSAGVSWLDVILGGQRLTRMALNLMIQRAPVPETTTAGKK